MTASDWQKRILRKGAAANPLRSWVGWVRSSRTLWSVLTLLAAIAFGQIAVRLGADANWDLRNYHLYNPFAVIEGRYDIDHNPASIQTYINPTLDLLLTYPAYTLANLRFATRVMGAVQGLNFVLILAIAFALRGSLGTSDRRLLVLLASAVALLGMTGALTISEIGSSMGDLTTAVAVLSGVLLALRSVGTEDGTTNFRMVAAAGLAVGIAAGLKLTNGVYLIALAVALMLMNGRSWVKTALAFGTGATVGLLATHGWWSWFLVQQTGNPVFPFFNKLFRSALFPDQTFFDPRFFPRDWLQALTYPFWFSWNSQTAELPFIDFRFPIAYVLAIGISIKLVVEKLRFDSKIALSPDRRRFWIFSVFLITAYILWQAMFSIQRYAVAIEVLLPAFILVALVILLGRIGWALFGVTAVLLAYTTVAPIWGRLTEEQAHMPVVSDKVRTAISPLLEDAAVIQGKPPLAYVASAFPYARTTWVGQALSEQDLKRALRKIASRSRLLTLRRPTSKDEAYVEDKLKLLGLPAAPTGLVGCQELPTVFDSLVLCEVETVQKAL